MGRRLLVVAPIFACVILAGCSGGATGQTRGCVALEVRVGGQARVQRVTLSLFAGSCAA